MRPFLDHRWASVPLRRDFPQAIQAFLLEPAAPQDNGVAIEFQFPRDGAVGLPRGGGQHDAAARADLLRRSEKRIPIDAVAALRPPSRSRLGAIARRIRNNRSAINCLIICWT